uniref:Uncharacterized protein n=1 Tax=Ciona intestinalis TaxID=7719 RepID=H2XP35_CIOIN
MRGRASSVGEVWSRGWFLSFVPGRFGCIGASWCRGCCSNGGGVTLEDKVQRREELGGWPLGVVGCLY